MLCASFIGQCGDGDGDAGFTESEGLLYFWDYLIRHFRKLAPISIANLPVVQMNNHVRERTIVSPAPKRKSR